MQIPPTTSVLITAILLLISTQVIAINSNDKNYREIDSTELLGSWDQELREAYNIIWALQDGSLEFGSDIRGRSLRDDIRDFVTTNDLQALLVKQRSIASNLLAAGKSDEARAAIQVARLALNSSAVVMNDVFNYWSDYNTLRANQSLWNEFAISNPVVVTLPRSSATTTLTEQLRTTLAKHDFRSAREQLYKLTRAYIDERNQIAKKMVGDHLINLNMLSYQQRRSPCTVPLTQTAKRNSPRFDHALHSIDEAYPKEATRLSLEGITILNIKVSNTGCALAAAIEVSSGSALLDDAALDWYEEASFLPAELNGNAISASLPLAVTFKMDERRQRKLSDY